MQNIGLIGAMSWESSAVYYQASTSACASGSAL